MHLELGTTTLVLSLKQHEKKKDEICFQIFNFK